MDVPLQFGRVYAIGLKSPSWADDAGGQITPAARGALVAQCWQPFTLQRATGTVRYWDNHPGFVEPSPGASWVLIAGRFMYAPDRTCPSTVTIQSPILWIMDIGTQGGGLFSGIPTGPTPPEPPPEPPPPESTGVGAIVAGLVVVGVLGVAAAWWLSDQS
jgi:hypothetical protein